jgi:plastocyanin
MRPYPLPSLRLTFLLPALAAALLPGVARAQTACVTPNCVFGGTPAQCQNRAAVLTPTVLMTTSGLNFVFNPQDPRIEPGGCIVWRAATVTHSASGNACPDDSLCGSPAPAACQFDTGNVASGSATPTATCWYEPAKFPAGTGDAYYCRIHATPTTGTMRGTLRVTTPIELRVDKEPASSSVKLSWTGGGVVGDASYKVARSDAGDPTFPSATTTTSNPDGGVLGTTFTDAGELSNPTTRYYLVRNKQGNE